MDLEQELREAFARDGGRLQLSGIGAPEVRRRGRRRHNRRRAGVATLTAAGMVGATVVAVATRPDSKASVAVQPRAEAPELKFNWRKVDGSIAYDSGVVVTGGVMYALSTAPGTNNATTVQTSVLYRTKDGEQWTTVGDANDLSALTADDGVLYAISTAPGASKGSYVLRTSENGGSEWSSEEIPISFTTPEADLPLHVSSSARVAHRGDVTVVAASIRFEPDFSGLDPDGAVKMHATPEGVEQIDLSKCSWMENKPTGTRMPGDIGLEEDCEGTQKTLTPWSEFGVTDPAALHQRQILVQRDGTWETFASPVPQGASVQYLQATSDGFLIVALPGDGSSAVIYVSSDGAQWERRAIPDGMYVHAASGDLLVASNFETGQMIVSSDGARSWSAVDIAGLVPGADPGYVLSATGPLGIAILAGPESGPNRLLHSVDGARWSVTDLEEHGAPNDSPQTLRVGADHIEVGYWVRSAPDQPAHAVALVATPER